MHQRQYIKITEKVTKMDHPYMNIYTLSNKRNSLHITLSLDKGTPLNHSSITAAYQDFMAQLIAVSGIPGSCVAHTGIFLSRNNQGRHAPHIHSLAYSVKSRKAGKTIACLSKDQKKELGACWVGRPLAHSLKIDPVFNVEGLADYFTGGANIQAPGQEWYPLPFFNASLAHRKAKQKLTRLHKAA